MNFFRKPRRNEVAIPSDAARDASSSELLRVWVAEGGQHISLRREAFEDPAAWGLVLSDLTKHAARAYAQGDGQDFDAILKRIQAELLEKLRSLKSDAS